ncbi:MAG TPA: hypothetical protein VH912_05810 [Streptosporangiaceae bacterium]|jgi:hypothetical protein
MTIKINENSMSTTIDRVEIAAATRTGDHWTASTCPHNLTRNQAITALTIAELLATGYSHHDLIVVALHAELAHG